VSETARRSRTSTTGRSRNLPPKWVTTPLLIITIAGVCWGFGKPLWQTLSLTAFAIFFGLQTVSYRNDEDLGRRYTEELLFLVGAFYVVVQIATTSGHLPFNTEVYDTLVDKARQWIFETFRVGRILGTSSLTLVFIGTAYGATAALTRRDRDRWHWGAKRFLQQITVPDHIVRRFSAKRLVLLVCLTASANLFILEMVTRMRTFAGAWSELGTREQIEMTALIADSAFGVATWCLAALITAGLTWLHVLGQARSTRQQSALVKRSLILIGSGTLTGLLALYL
jgi:hypothetical protein